MWRWAKRNKAVASLTAATFILFFAVAITASIAYIRTSNALRREAQQRQRAEVVIALASDALNKIFASLDSNRPAASALTIDSGMPQIQIPSQPVISSSSAALLEEMLPFYDRLAAQTGNNPRLQLRAADARRRIGDIHLKLGQYNQAMDSYNKTVAMYSALIAKKSADKTLLIKLAQTYNEIGNVYLLQREIADSEKTHDKAMAILNNIEIKSPAVNYELARTYYMLGKRIGIRSIRHITSNGPGDFPAQKRDEDHMGPPDSPGPDNNNNVPRDIAPDRKIRNKNLEKAVTLLNKLIHQEPDNPNYRYLLGMCYREYVAPFGQFELNTVDKAIKVFKELTKVFPQVTDYQFELCQSYAAIEAMGPANQELFPEIQQRLLKAQKLAYQLTMKYPDVPAYKITQANIYNKLSNLYIRDRRPFKAGEIAQKAFDIYTQLVKSFPNNITYKIRKILSGNTLARTMILCDQPQKAHSIAQDNMDTLNKLIEQNPDRKEIQALKEPTSHILYVTEPRPQEWP